MNLRRACVFCGSSRGFSPVYVEAAQELGRTLAKNRIGLVYGGAHVGMMGALADAALAAGGHVTGVIPESLVAREIAHTQLSDLRIVSTMHQRKALMADLSDAFIALPGGFGTLDEFCEVLTWSQLGIHAKPCGLLNIAGYYDPLLALFDRAVHDGLLKPANRAMVIAETAAAPLLEKLSRGPVPRVDKWVGPLP
jgi:uncharacterized protein (TIGR00730 family)